jgi:hypothetical protein
MSAWKAISCVLGVVLVVFVVTASRSEAEPGAEEKRSPRCAEVWTSTVVASGLGALENLESDRRGGFYLSAIIDGRILHVDGSGNANTVLSGLDHPAGLRLSGGSLYFLTGNNLGDVRGTLQRLDLATGQAATLLTGLPAPNGLLLLPDGDLLFSQLTFPPVGIDRYSPATGRHTKSWSNTPFPNGLTLSDDGAAIYTENTVLSTILRLPLGKPNSTTEVARLPGIFAGSDDMQATRDGMLYVAGDTSGEVYAINPRSGDMCVIAKGLNNQRFLQAPPYGPTSVRIGPGPAGPALYVVAIDGALRRLDPPPGIKLAPTS